MSDLLKRRPITAISKSGNAFHCPWRNCDALALATPVNEKRSSTRTVPALAPSERLKRSQISVGVSAGENALPLSTLQLTFDRLAAQASDITTPDSPTTVHPTIVKRRFMRLLYRRLSRESATVAYFAGYFATDRKISPPSTPSQHEVTSADWSRCGDEDGEVGYAIAIDVAFDRVGTIAIVDRAQLARNIGERTAADE